MSVVAQKPALLVGVNGTLVFAPPEGTPTSGTVTIYDKNGDEAVASSAGTVVGATLTTAILAAILDDKRENWRAAWVYVVATVTYRFNQLFDVVAAVARPPLSEAEFVERYPVLTTRFVRGATTHAAARSQGWERVCATIERSKLKLNRVIDSTAFVAAQAHFAAAVVFRNLGVGDGDAWQQMAADAEAAGEGEMTARLANLWWYDADEDLRPGGGEADVHAGTVRLSR